MPPFTLQDCIQDGAGTELRHHRLQRARMRFFFQRAFAQKIFNVMLVGQCPIALVAKFRLMFFLGRFHPANGNVGAQSAVQPSLKPAPECVGQSGEPVRQGR